MDWEWLVGRNYLNLWGLATEGSRNKLNPDLLWWFFSPPDAGFSQVLLQDCSSSGPFLQTASKQNLTALERRRRQFYSDSFTQTCLRENKLDPGEDRTDQRMKTSQKTPI